MMPWGSFSKYPSSVHSHEKYAIRVPSPTMGPIACVGWMTMNAKMNDMIDPAARKKARISSQTLIQAHAYMAITKGKNNKKYTVKHSRYHRAQFVAGELCDSSRR
jgi:hypothetical protein